MERLRIYVLAVVLSVALAIGIAYSAVVLENSGPQPRGQSVDYGSPTP